MKLLTTVLATLLSLTLAKPLAQQTNNIENPNVTEIDCPVRPEAGKVSASLCSENDWLGYCHVFVTCEGSCYDLVDQGVIGNFGDGVSSVIWPVGQTCKFFSARSCDWTAGPWDGSFSGQRDVDWFGEGPNDKNPRHPMLNNKIKSFKCSHADTSVNEPTSKVKRENAPEATEAPEESSTGALEQRAVSESADIAVPAADQTSAKTTVLQQFTMQTCTSRDYVDCYLWNFLEGNGQCLSGIDNANLKNTKSIILQRDGQCVLYRNSQGCSGDNVLLGHSEPRLDWFPNEGGVVADMENHVGSILCCVGWSNKEGCHGSCLCDLGLVAQPGKQTRRSEAIESSPIEADSIAVRSARTASSVVGQPIESDANAAGYFTLQTCTGKDYGNCELWPGLINGRCLNNRPENNYLAHAKSIKLSEQQSCVLSTHSDCSGENVVIAQSEPRLDFFPFEGGVIADMEDKIQSVWCCQGPGSADCGGTCLCDNGVTMQPGGPARKML